jgi:hypothetical protein
MPLPKKRRLEKAPINRREFLHLSLVAGGSVILAACQEADSGIATATKAVATSTASPSPVPPVKVSLIGSDQEVWAWVKQVKVKVTGKCERLIVTANGQEFESQPDGEDFTAEIRLSA